MPNTPDSITAYGAQNAARVAAALGLEQPAPKPAVPVYQTPAAPDLELTPPGDEKAARKNRHLERAEQERFFAEVRRCCHPATGAALPGRDGADCIAALANENAAGKAIGLQRWRMGVSAGLPDIALFVARPGFHGLFIEMKRQDGVASDVRQNQRDWHDRLGAAGYKVIVAYGWRRAWACLCDYLGWEAG